MKLYLALFLAVFGVLAIFAQMTAKDWRTASRESAGLAPDPATTSEAVVQIYAARAINWRGWFAVHSWIAIKQAGASAYTTFHVMGFRLDRTGSAVVQETDIPDRLWYGAKPELIDDLRGEMAERAIPRIIAAAQAYPYARTYRAWPGPNSNTFISFIIRAVPELGVELPPHAIGKDWGLGGLHWGRSETGSGYQFNLLGIFGATIGKAEGVEINLLGLNFGIDILRPALKLPVIGRIGLSDKLIDQK